LCLWLDAKLCDAIVLKSDCCEMSLEGKSSLLLLSIDYVSYHLHERSGNGWKYHERRERMNGDDVMMLNIHFKKREKCINTHVCTLAYENEL
jgi:hypothetical protein